MLNNISKLIISISSIIALLAGCVSQGSYDSVVQERDQLVEKNRSLESELALTQQQKDEIVDKGPELLEAFQNETVKTTAKFRPVLREMLSENFSDEDIQKILAGQIS